MGPVQSSTWRSVEMEVWIGRHHSSPLAQHRVSRQKQQLPASPWGGKGLVQAPRILIRLNCGGLLLFEASP